MRVSKSNTKYGGKRGITGANAAPVIDQVSVSPRGFESQKLSPGCPLPLRTAVHRARLSSTSRLAPEDSAFSPAGCLGRHVRERHGPAGKVTTQIPSLASSDDGSVKDGAGADCAPAGLLYLAITSIGWGFNWPRDKVPFVRSAAAHAARLDRHGRGGAPDAACTSPQAKPACPRSDVAAAGARGAAQRHLLDGVDDARAIVSGGERNGAAYTMPVWALILASARWRCAHKGAAPQGAALRASD